MKENSYGQIDDLLGKVKLKLLKLRESDPVTVEELKSLLTQLEDFVESLVIDSLKLKSLESRPKAVTKPRSTSQKRPRNKEG